MPIITPSTQPPSYQPQYQNDNAATEFGQTVAGAVTGLGNAVSNAANSATNIVQRIQQDRDTALIYELENEYSNSSRKLLSGDPDNPAYVGYYSRNGKDALDNSAPTVKELDTIKRKVLEKSTNGYVKKQLSRLINGREQSHLSNLTSHMVKERAVYQNTLSEARMQEAVDDGVSAYNSPEVIARSRVIVDGEVRAMGERQGWDKEVVDSKLQEARTHLYSSMIRSAIQQGNTVAAKSLFEKYEGEMDAPVAAQIKEQMHQLVLRADAQSAFDRYSTIANEEQAIAAVRREFRSNPELREEVERRLRNEFAYKTQIENRMQNEAMSHVFGSINNGFTTQEALNKLTEEARQLVFRDSNALSQFHNAEEAVANGQLFATSTDGKTYAQLKTQETRALAETSPERYRYKLTMTEYNKLVTDVASAQRRLEQGNDVAAKVLNNAEADATRDLKTNRTYFTSKGKAKEQFNGVITDLRNWVYSEVDRTGKAPSDREIKQKVAELSTTFEGDTAPGWTGWLQGGFGPTRAKDLTEEQIESLSPEDQEKVRQLKAVSAIPSGNVIDRIIQAESGGDPTATNPRSSATGAGQVIASTWLELFNKRYPEDASLSRAEKLALRNDPVRSRAIVTLYAEENSQKLQNAGYSVTPTSVYLAHHFGATGAIAILNSDEDAMASTVLSKGAVRANPWVKGLTTQQVVNDIHRRIS